MLLNEIMKLIDAGYTKEEIMAFTETKPEKKPETKPENEIMAFTETKLEKKPETKPENMSVKDLIRQVIDEVQSENRGASGGKKNEPMSVDDFLKKVIEEGR